MGGIRKALRRLGSDEGGASIVEFALVIGPFMLIVIAILEFGYQSYVGVVADSAANRVARDATAGTITPGDVEAEARRLIEPALLSTASMTVETRSYFDFTSVGRPEQVTVDSDGDGDVSEGDCFIDENGNADFDHDTGQSGLGGADDVVIYEIAIESPNLTGISDLLGTSVAGFMVNAAATGRNQPFDDQDVPVLQEYCMNGGINVAV